MTDEYRIASIVLGLPTTAALAQDISAGETSFRKCLVCRSVGTDTRNKIGPLLNGIEGRKCGKSCFPALWTKPWPGICGLISGRSASLVSRNDPLRPAPS
jgi:hypothetical protein